MKNNKILCGRVLGGIPMVKTKDTTTGETGKYQPLMERVDIFAKHQ